MYMDCFGRFSKYISLNLIAAFFTQQVAFAAPNNQELKSQLDLSLTSIEDNARTGRYVGGGVFLGLGGVLGALSLTVDSPSGTNTNSISDAAVFGIVGGLFAVTGGLILLFPSDFEKVPQKYRLMSDKTAEDLHSKVLFGEASLQNLADDARQSRYLSGGILTAGGVALTALYAASNSNYSYNASTDRYFLYEGIIFVGCGILTLLVESKPEQVLKNYKAWKQGSPLAAGSLFSEIKPVLAPAPGGLAGGVSLSF
jgi:hypothetical protein